MEFEANRRRWTWARCYYDEPGHKEQFMSEEEAVSLNAAQTDEPTHVYAPLWALGEEPITLERTGYYGIPRPQKKNFRPDSSTLEIGTYEDEIINQRSKKKRDIAQREWERLETEAQKDRWDAEKARADKERKDQFDRNVIMSNRRLQEMRANERAKEYLSRYEGTQCVIRDQEETLFGLSARTEEEQSLFELLAIFS